jgi:hypothetical protein
MKDKQFDPARHNEKSPAPGLAAVNTHNPEEQPMDQVLDDQLGKSEEGGQRNDEPQDDAAK